jgi:EAL domain-containing protein (putative c-di-GMP-specific phosphodiesterase class I)
VNSLGRDENSSAIINAIVALGRALDLTVTAEGVETKEQERFLHGAGCHELQGYLYAKALPVEQVARLFENPRQAQRDAVLRPAPIGT